VHYGYPPQHSGSCQMEQFLHSHNPFNEKLSM
jgi:hypothetical protein